jgi:AcrR family transcriptional regulator
MAKTDTESGKAARKRAAKRDALLAEASRQLNERGAGALALNDIAEQVGLSRNALYYYVEDRTDLVFRCYLRSCEAMADDLGAAHDGADAPVGRIAAFLERSLAFDRPPVAVLSDVDILPAEQRGLIRTQQARNLDGLRGLLDDGIRSGALRRCDTEIVAQSVIGMLSWARLSARWLAHRDGPAARRRMAAAIGDVMLNGFAARRDLQSGCDLDVSVLTAKSFNAFDRQQAAEVKAEQLVAAASRLFNRKGIDGASLDEIAASVGATKGALYHYFDDKAALVVACYARAFDLYETMMDASLAFSPNGLDRSIATMHLNIQAQAGPVAPMMLQPGFFAMPQGTRDAFALRARKMRNISSRVLREGIAEGSCRPLDTVYAPEMTAGLFFWVPKWLPENSTRTPIELADETAALFTYGIASIPSH